MTEHDVNQQHLIAMGLGGVRLGEKYDQSLYSPDRCDQTLGSARCARKAGHEGVHARGALAWEPEPKVEPEEVEPPTPEYVFRLIAAMINGDLPDFDGVPVPKDVEETIHRWLS